MSLNSDFGIMVQEGKNNIADQYLLFQVGEDTFCVNVEQVNQIEFYDTHNKIPASQDYILGIAKSRGKIVTIVHLGIRLKIHKKAPKKNMSHIIYIDKGNDKLIGMLVDRVVNLVNIPKNTIKEDLDMINTNIPLDFLKGAATINDQIAVLLNLELVLSNFEVEDIGYSLRGDTLDETDQDLSDDELDEYDISNSKLDEFDTKIIDEDDDDDDDDLFESVSADTIDLVTKTPEDRKNIPKQKIESVENIEEEEEVGDKEEDDEEVFDSSDDEDDEFI